MSNRPILIVITPVRNEAWVLDAKKELAISLFERESL